METFAIEPLAPADASGFMSAALWGDALAQFKLGFAHYLGNSVSQSFELSYFWMSVVAGAMPEHARPMLWALSTRLNAEVRKMLDREAARWQPGMLPPSLCLH